MNGKELLPHGMTWCQKCCAPMQLVSCPHHKYFEVDPRDSIDETIDTIDGREKLLHEMYYSLITLVNRIIWAEDNDMSIMNSDDFRWAEHMVESYWEWGPGEALQVLPDAIMRREKYRRRVPR